MKTSRKFALDVRDFLKASIMAILTPVLFVLQQSLDKGVFTLDWKQIAIAAASGFVGYLIKNYFTPEQIVVKTENKKSEEV